MSRLIILIRFLYSKMFSDKKTKKMSSQDDDAVLVDESDDDETLFLDGVKSSQM